MLEVGGGRHLGQRQVQTGIAADRERRVQLAGVRAGHAQAFTNRETLMYNIFYLIGVIVVILAVLSFVGLR